MDVSSSLLFRFEWRDRVLFPRSVVISEYMQLYRPSLQSRLWSWVTCETMSHVQSSSRCSLGPPAPEGQHEATSTCYARKSRWVLLDPLMVQAVISIWTNGPSY